MSNDSTDGRLGRGDQWQVIRNPQRDRFVVVDRLIVRDKKLSYRARGVLVWVFDQPPGTPINRHVLTANGSEGEDAMRSTLKELVDAGYIHHDRVRVDNGRIITKTVVYECPVDRRGETTLRSVTGGGKPPGGNHPPVNHPPERSTRGRAGISSVTSKPPPPITPHDQAFDTVWPNYPRKIKKVMARKAFIARLRAGVPLAELAEATRNYAKATRGKDPEYIMHGATFYGPNENWKDYLTGGPGIKSTRREIPDRYR